MPELNSGVSPRVLPNGAVLSDNADLSVPTTDIGLADPEYLASTARSELRAAKGIGSAALNSLNSLWDFVKFPGEVAAGKYSLDEISRAAPGYALGLAGLGTPIGAAAAPESALGIFAGRKSLTASPTSLARAQVLEKYRGSPEDIQALTGWFRGPDDQWRYTIPDESARLNPTAFRPNQYNPAYLRLSSSAGRPLSQVLEHPEFFAAYPDIGKYYVHSMPAAHLARGIEAGWSGLGVPNPQFLLGDVRPQNMLSNLLHEVQHSVQDTEGFARGGGIDEFLPAGFAERMAQQSRNVESVKQLTKELHPEFSDMDLVHVHNMLNGYISPQGDKVLSRVHPLLRAQILPLSQEALGLRVSRQLAIDDYTRLAGEVESRAVQEQLARQDWTTPIWRHEGYIPFKQQIVKTPGTPGYNLVPIEHDPFQLTPVDHNPFEEPRP